MKATRVVTATPPLALARPTEPLAVPPKASDSPIVTSSLPPRRLAATAVRPSCALAILTLRAEMRRSRSESLKPFSVIGS